MIDDFYDEDETVTAEDWEEACEVAQYDLQDMEDYLDNEDN